MKEWQLLTPPEATRDKLAAIFALEFGPLLNVLDLGWPRRQKS